MTSIRGYASICSSVFFLALVVAGGCGDSPHTLGSTGGAGRGGASAGTGGTTSGVGGSGGAIAGTGGTTSGVGGSGGAIAGSGGTTSGVGGSGGAIAGAGGTTSGVGGSGGAIAGAGGTTSGVGGSGGTIAGRGGTGGSAGAGGAAGRGATGGTAGSGNSGGGGAAGTTGRGGTSAGGNGGMGGVTGLGGTTPVVACLTVQTLDRSCTTDADCFAATNIADCCGRLQYIGLRTSEQTRYTNLEQQCQTEWPACTCVTRPTITDDGSTIKSSMTVGVTCHQGICTTFVPACGGPCAAGLTCFSCQVQGGQFAACTTPCTDTDLSSDCMNAALPHCQLGQSGNVDGTYCTASGVMCDLR